MLWELCPILDKPSEQENSYSEKRSCITVQYPQGSGNDRSKGICLIFFLYFTGPSIKLQCEESVGRYQWSYQNKPNTAFASGLKVTFFYLSRFMAFQFMALQIGHGCIAAEHVVCR